MRYSSAQKAVAALVAIGKPKAAELLKLLSRNEISKLMETAKTMSAVTQDGLELIVEDFEFEFTRGSGLIDSSSQMESILGESFDEAELVALRTDSSTRIKTKTDVRSAWEVLEQTESVAIAAYLQSENAQVGAYVLSRLPSDKAAEILKLIERNERLSILTRMMALSEVSQDAQELLQDELLEQFGKPSKGSNKIALTRVATILNELDRDVTEEMLGDLSQKADIDEVTVVKSMLFRFDDIIALEPSARTAIFDAVPSDTLTLALREVPADLTEAILSSISQRTRRMIENDLKSAAKVRPNDILVARKKIVGAILKLAGEGKITLVQPEREAA